MWGSKVRATNTVPTGDAVVSQQDILPETRCSTHVYKPQRGQTDIIPSMEHVLLELVALGAVLVDQELTDVPRVHKIGELHKNRGLQWAPFLQTTEGLHPYRTTVGSLPADN